MKTTLLLATARRLAARSAARAAPAALASWRLSAHPLAAATPTTIATRAFSKKPRPTGDESDSSDDERESSDDEFSDEEEDDEDEDDEEEEEEDDETYEAAKRAAFTEEDLEKFEDPAEYWDEERWGKLDSEDWAGFTGDLDAVTEEGVPVWLQSVRDLSAEQQEKRMRAKLARRALEEAKMNIKRYRKVDALGRAYGTGRRKTSTARVWIKKTATPFDGNIKVNKKDLADYFVRDTHREEVLKPFVVVNEIGNFDVYATVAGGGLTGQAGALRHGIARALQHFDPEMRPALKKEKLLKRDPRAVERKKAGQKKARKKFQWVKR